MCDSKYHQQRIWRNFHIEETGKSGFLKWQIMHIAENKRGWVEQRKSSSWAKELVIRAPVERLGDAYGAAEAHPWTSCKMSRGHLVAHCVTNNWCLKMNHWQFSLCHGQQTRVTTWGTIAEVIREWKVACKLVRGVKICASRHSEVTWILDSRE